MRSASIGGRVLLPKTGATHYREIERRCDCGHGRNDAGSLVFQSGQKMRDGKICSRSRQTCRMRNSAKPERLALWAGYRQDLRALNKSKYM